MLRGNVPLIREVTLSSVINGNGVNEFWVFHTLSDMLDQCPDINYFFLIVNGSVKHSTKIFSNRFAEFYSLLIEILSLYHSL